ncbi:1715_t:CDS:2 [Funneliformis geosporum]|nr:1715_t:CDS:2 [Funneliformis geosporum]
MRKVANYCIIDALHCQELLVKLSQINDYREVTFIVHVFLFDSHYRANGMKIQNLLSAYAFKRDMVFNSKVCKNIEKVKYPGIETRRPITGLDFASLYPSLIMAYNISLDKIILTYKETDIAEKNGNILHNIEFPFNNCTVQARNDLSNKRLELKACLAPLGKKRQHFGKIISSAKKKGKRIPESLNSEYSSVYFDYDYWDSKQKALKTGNSKSLIFLRELAGGTTSNGKYNLNLATKFVTKKGFGIKYGDTDSLYLTCQDKYYEKCDEAFSRKDLSKEAYVTEMVNITMIVMKSLCDQVNAYLRIKNSTSYLKIAYEEVLFPVCFAGKKKYFGRSHEDVVNFRPNDLFMREIDTVKQGNSELFRFIGEKIMWEVMGINIIHSIRKIVEGALQDARFKQ